MDCKEKLNEIDRVKDSISRREDEPATWLEHIQKELEITNCELSKLKRNTDRDSFGPIGVFDPSEGGEASRQARLECKHDKYFILKFIIEKTLNPIIAIEFCKIVDMTEK